MVAAYKNTFSSIISEICAGDKPADLNTVIVYAIRREEVYAEILSDKYNSPFECMIAACVEMRRFDLLVELIKMVDYDDLSAAIIMAASMENYGVYMLVKDIIYQYTTPTTYIDFERAANVCKNDTSRDMVAQHEREYTARREDAYDESGEDEDEEPGEERENPREMYMMLGVSFSALMFLFALSSIFRV